MPPPPRIKMSGGVNFNFWCPHVIDGVRKKWYRFRISALGRQWEFSDMSPTSSKAFEACSWRISTYYMRVHMCCVRHEMTFSRQSPFRDRTPRMLALRKWWDIREECRTTSRTENNVYSSCQPAWMIDSGALSRPRSIRGNNGRHCNKWPWAC